MSFTPSMSAEAVRKLDAERGKGPLKDDPFDTFPSHDNPKDKQPWFIETPVHKPEEEIEMSTKKANKEAVDLLKSFSESTAKALSTKSYHVPRPLGEYDPYGIMRSATTTTSHRHTALKGVNGVAPDVMDTMMDVASRKVHPETDVYKTCPAHGTIYKSQKGCWPCDVFKSSLCKGCDGEMDKGPAGAMVCKNCG